jgi:uncharacterized protein
MQLMGGSGMKVFAIGDLHLGEGVNKPMDIFGGNWDAHTDKIAQNWRSCISEEDLVLLPGDISWAMTLSEAQLDLAWIGQLPGQKVMIRGNHDYWWSGISKVRRILPDGLFAIQNDAILFQSITICGTRGWLLPTHPKFSVEDETIYLREIARLRLSLEAAKKIHISPIIVMMHYPPLSVDGISTVFTDLFESYEVETCVYGHLHGTAARFGYNGIKNGVKYQLTSCDSLQFKPIELVNGNLSFP